MWVEHLIAVVIGALIIGVFILLAYYGVLPILVIVGLSWAVGYGATVVWKGYDDE